jgi:hypothetical protein
MFDGKAIGEHTVLIVRDYVARVFSPLQGRVEAVERRLDNLPVPKDGKDASPEMVSAELAKFAKELADRFRGEDGG